MSGPSRVCFFASKQHLLELLVGSEEGYDRGRDPLRWFRRWARNG